MTGAETYLRELRRALPIGYRRRFVAEVREHFESAVAAEAAHGVESEDAERLTIERLGPPRAVAEQMLTDLRNGALGPLGRLCSALTVARLVAAAVLVTALIAGVALIGVRSSSKTPTVQRASESPAVHNGVEIRTLVVTLADAQGKKVRWYAQPGPVRLRVTQFPPRQVWLSRPGMKGVPTLRVTQASP